MKKKLIIISVAIIFILSASAYLIFKNPGKTLNRDYSNTEDKAKTSNPAAKHSPSQPVSAASNNLQTSIPESSSPWGNTPSNIINGGEFYLNGEDLFYCLNPYSESDININFIHSKKDAVTNSKIISTFDGNTVVSSLNYSGGWMYFVENNEGIYKCRPDGSEKSQVLPGNILIFTIYNNYAYYINNGILYKANIDNIRDTAKELYSNVSSFSMSQDGKQLYFSCVTPLKVGDTKQTYTIYKMDLNNISKVNAIFETSSIQCYLFYTYKNYLYLVDDREKSNHNYTDNNYGTNYYTANIVRINTEVQNAKPEIYASNYMLPSSININNNFLYYISISNKYALNLTIKDLNTGKENTVDLKVSIKDSNLLMYNIFAFNDDVYISSVQNSVVFDVDAKSKTFKKIYASADEAIYYIDKN